MSNIRKEVIRAEWMGINLGGLSWELELECGHSKTFTTHSKDLKIPQKVICEKCKKVLEEK